MADETERARQISDLTRWLRSWVARENAERGARRRIVRFRRWADAVDALAAELDAAEKERDEAQNFADQAAAEWQRRATIAEKRNGELLAALRLAYPYVEDQAQEGSKALRDVVRADLDVIGPLLAASGAGEETT